MNTKNNSVNKNNFMNELYDVLQNPKLTTLERLQIICLLKYFISRDRSKPLPPISELIKITEGMLNKVPVTYYILLAQIFK